MRVLQRFCSSLTLEIHLGIESLSLVMAPDHASTLYLRLSIPPLPQWLPSILYFHRLPCSRCLCRHAELSNSLPVALKICCFVQVGLSWSVLPVCTLVLACAEEDMELPGLLSPLLLRDCIPASPLLLRVRPGRSPIALISAAVQ